MSKEYHLSQFAKDAAHEIMANLRQRGELEKILGPVKPDGGPWIAPHQQVNIEHRIAQIITIAYEPRITDLLNANNAEVERRRLADATVSEYLSMGDTRKEGAA